MLKQESITVDSVGILREQIRIDCFSALRLTGANFGGG